MKFAWKVFLSSILVVTAAFGIGGTLMISSLYHQALDQELRMATQENRYLCFSFGTAVDSLTGPFNTKQFLSQMNDVMGERSSDFSICSQEEVRFPDGPEFAENIPVNTRASRVVTDENGVAYIQIVTRVQLSGDIFSQDTYFAEEGESDAVGQEAAFQDDFASGVSYYLESLTDISYIYQMRDEYIALYRWILLAVVGVSSIILLILSHLLTRPLKRLTNVTQEIASGSFSTRATEKGSDEISALTRNFNAMADVVEEKIHDLEETARQREDFIASFAHELKTPLTSIIGYADMLRSYDMDVADRLTAANYIFSEGKRLESLSLHLLDLIVLHKQDFPLTPIDSAVFTKEVGNILMPLLQKHQQTLQVKAARATLLLEPSLMKTLLYNLIDNACKASEKGGEIFLTGEWENGRYRFSVQDHGRGIPEEELSKITEPFYMIDKSRARKQNGAGLGLALCRMIAQLHGDDLHFTSKLGEGTCVSFFVKEASKNET